MSLVHFTPVTAISLQPLPLMHVRCRDSKRRISAAASYSAAKYARRLLVMTGFVPILFNVNPVFTAPIPEMNEPEIIRTVKLPGGTRIQDIVAGEGKSANGGDIVVFNYVCRRSNGYFVYSTVDQFTGEATPVTLPLDENQIIKGLKDVIVGMKIGGKRRALIPPSMGYVDEYLKPIPNEFGPRRSLLSHANEPLIFEVIDAFIGEDDGTGLWESLGCFTHRSP